MFAQHEEGRLTAAYDDAVAKLREQYVAALKEKKRELRERFGSAASASALSTPRTVVNVVGGEPTFRGHHGSESARRRGSAHMLMA